MAIAKQEHAVNNEPNFGGPRSLTRLLALFAELSRWPDGLSLSELNTVLDVPKSSLLNLLRPLVADGYILHNRDKYLLGPAIFRLSAAVLSAWDFPKTIRNFMENLSRRTDETVLLSIVNTDPEVLIYLDVINSPHPVRYTIQPGTIRPLYASSPGRVLLAYADNTWLKNYLSSLVIKAKTHEPITRASLKHDIDKVRREGVAWSIDGNMLGLSSVAAPVFDPTGNCVAALSIAGPSDRFRGELDELIEIVKGEAARATGVLITGLHST